MMTSSHRAVMDRIRGEYLEMPGMSLKIEQVQRLCGVDRAACAMVLDALVAIKFLHVRVDGTYARLTAESGARLRPAKAHLEESHATPRTIPRAS